MCMTPQPSIAAPASRGILGGVDEPGLPPLRRGESTDVLWTRHGGIRVPIKLALSGDAQAVHRLFARLFPSLQELN